MHQERLRREDSRAGTGEVASVRQTLLIVVSSMLWLVIGRTMTVETGCPAQRNGVLRFPSHKLVSDHVAEPRFRLHPTEEIVEDFQLVFDGDDVRLGMAVSTGFRARARLKRKSQTHKHFDLLEQLGDESSLGHERSKNREVPFCRFVLIVSSSWKRRLDERN